MKDRQGWRLSVFISAVGIAGALIGYSLQHILSIERERSSAFETRQHEAYEGFIKAFEKDRVARMEEGKGNTANAAQLKAEFELEAGTAARRIAIYGDKQVVKAMADWYRSWVPQNPPPCDKIDNAELATWQKMREALQGRNQNVSQDDFAAVILRRRCRPGSGQ